MSKQQEIEGLLFVSGVEGVSLDQLSSLTGYAKPAVLSMLEKMQEDYNKDENRSFSIIETGGTYKLVTKKNLSDLLDRYFDRSNRNGLSPAALEILSIVAYKQPITRVEVDDIRGVQSGATLQNLVLRNLLTVKGRLDEPGRPKTYGTTNEFLDYFGLKNLDELPALDKIENDDNESDSDLFLKEFEDKMNIDNEEK